MSSDTEASGQSGSGSKSGSESTDSGSQPGSEGTGTETFTQEQVQRIVTDNVRKERAKFADYGEVKARLAELEDKDRTELERAQAAAKDSDAKAAAAVARANQLAVRSAITAAASRAGAVDPDLVVALLAAGTTLDDDGNVAGDVDRAVVELLEAKPYLRANGSAPAASGYGKVDAGAHGRSSAAPPATPGAQMDDVLRRNR